MSRAEKSDSVVAVFELSLFRFKSLLQRVHLIVQLLWKALAELRKVFANARNFGEPAININTQQLRKICGRHLQSRGVKVRSIR